MKAKKLLKKGNGIELRQLVDEGYELDSLIKKHKKRLDVIKEKLKEAIHSNEKYQQVKEIVGYKGCTAKFSPLVKTNIDPKKFDKFCKEKGKEVWPYLSVKIGEAKKVFGEKDLEPITDKETDEFGKVSFKKEE